MRWLCVVGIVGCLGVPAVAAADAVDPCPPGFDPSHTGCRLRPRGRNLAT